MKSQPKILLIEDDAGIVGGLKKELHVEGYEAAVVERRGKPHIVLGQLLFGGH